MFVNREGPNQKTIELAQNGLRFFIGKPSELWQEVDLLSYYFGVVYSHGFELRQQESEEQMQRECVSALWIVCVNVISDVHIPINNKIDWPLGFYQLCYG